MKTTIKIHGMHCASCEALLTDVLSETEGVKSVKVSLKDGNATVDFDDKTVSETRLRQSIEAEGYKTA